ncbi:ROK family protein [Selenomonas caprae]|uniref:Sugar kinase of the NBD/HSP70 family, may contain an N-terminal HTH domain n=2 Tax=Selenomonas TaxID=970 RepID=A0A1I3FXP4_SELRU|nr:MULTISPECIES: ROK family protein [Selenomonas]MBQ1889219.1 ROK family protein [Selenomonas sp.]TYZ31085.1 ROK family protein [Selenomonas caprae]SFI15949.1 Sugar kinase of the NBD/HSP70 family, may contain an N-terminal HTH domain [Selenomonas ruminantium]
MKNYVAIDIGGTAIKYGLTDAQGNFTAKKNRPTLAREEGGAGIVRKVVEIVRQYQAEMPIAGVAIDTAGIVNPVTGEIVFAGETSFPGYSGTPLGKLVREACGVPCVVENDVNAAALGEYWQGAAKGASSAFMMTVGTGIGGCFILEGKAWHGAGFSAGEAGFMRLHGEQRIFEEAASTRAMLVEAAASHNVSPAELTGEQVFAWALAGDADAVLAIEHMVDNLAEGIANIYCLLNPEVFVLGGGVMAQQDYLRPRLEQRLEALVVPAMRTSTRLEFARLGNDAGMVGALYSLLTSTTI